MHAQVEPHFLYNTLASAQLLTRSDPALADEMLGHLIQYLRHSLVYGADAALAVVANFPAGVAATITVPATFDQGAHHG